MQVNRKNGKELHAAVERMARNSRYDSDTFFANSRGSVSQRAIGSGVQIRGDRDTMRERQLNSSGSLVTVWHYSRCPHWRRQGCSLRRCPRCRFRGSDESLFHRVPGRDE
jgi:hypothetical protein